MEDSDLDAAGSWLESHPALLERFLKEKATPQFLQRITKTLQELNNTTTTTNNTTAFVNKKCPPPTSVSPQQQQQSVHQNEENEEEEEKEEEETVITTITNNYDFQIETVGYLKSTKNESQNNQQTTNNVDSYLIEHSNIQSQRGVIASSESEARLSAASGRERGESNKKRNSADFIGLYFEKLETPNSTITTDSSPSPTSTTNLHQHQQQQKHQQFQQNQQQIATMTTTTTSISTKNSTDVDVNDDKIVENKEENVVKNNNHNSKVDMKTSNSSKSLAYLEQPKLESISNQNKMCSGNKRSASINSDLFQLWLAASPHHSNSNSLNQSNSSSNLNNGQQNTTKSLNDLKKLSESELFMELIRDVANELDIDVLCHKILRNVSLLTHADRGSLFLARGPSEERYLVAKLFDVRHDTDLEEAVKTARCEDIRIPFGVGIAGSVAQSKTLINIKDAYNDPRFNNTVDMRTGYKTNAILCMPICNYEGDVIGVAQIINKTNDSQEFTQHDVEVFQRYLTFCGIGLQNAQLFEVSVLEYKRNQILLNLARSIFEEQNNLECLVTKIMREAQDLLKCERCAVYLIDLDCCEASHLEKIVERPELQALQPQEKNRPLGRLDNCTFSADEMIQSGLQTPCTFRTVFELRESGTQSLVSRPSSFDLQSSTLAQIASYAAVTGQILNIANVKTWLTERHAEGDAESARTILCMPIINSHKQLIGVAQLINKINGSPFTDCDVSLFEAFAIFCGLGIHNTQMYENACKLMAKQKVALECLSYHATATITDTEKLANAEIPSAEIYNLYSFTFIDFELNDDETCKATIRMFMECNLVTQFHIPYEVLCRWVLSVKKNYRPVKYHNWRHAFNVAQSMFAMFKTAKMERFMSDLEMLGLLVACLCHDLDHRGTNNAFQTKTESPLAILYTTSTMEHHHFDQCVMILNSDCNNIFQSLGTDDYRKVMKLVEAAILSTDLAMYFKKKNKFLELIDNGEFDWQSDDKKELLSGMMMTACDVSAIAKPWEVQHRVAKLVADEFFDQGDMEKLQLKEQPVAMMDRERKDELPQMQVGFIDVICLPLYRVLSETFPWMKPLYDGTLENRKNWQDLAEKVEMGLTWIDHDTIDKPVEAFADTEETKDIELTVQTLQTNPALQQTQQFPSHFGPKLKRRHKLCCLL